jgi:hypothetical protein
MASGPRLAAWLALLAVAVRVLLPGLHEHGCARAVAAATCAHAHAGHGEHAHGSVHGCTAAADHPHGCAACLVLATAPGWTPCEQTPAIEAAPPHDRSRPRPVTCPRPALIAATPARGPPHIDAEST